MSNNESKISMFNKDVNCPHVDKCSDYDMLCDTCKNNKNRKKSYYERERPYIPPYRPYYEPVWFDDTRIRCGYDPR